MPPERHAPPSSLARLAILSLGFAALLVACTAVTSAASEAEIVLVTVTRPECPLAEDADGKSYFLRGDGLPAKLAKGDRLKLTGHRVMTRFLPKDPACRGFDFVFEVEHAEPSGAGGAGGVAGRARLYE